MAEIMLYNKITSEDCILFITRNSTKIWYWNKKCIIIFKRRYSE